MGAFKTVTSTGAPLDFVLQFRRRETIKIDQSKSIEQKLQDLEEMFRRTGKYNLKVADFIALMRKHGRIIDIGLSGVLEINYDEIGNYIEFMKTKENEVIRILNQLKKVNSQFDL